MTSNFRNYYLRQMRAQKRLKKIVQAATLIDPRERLAGRILAFLKAREDGSTELQLRKRFPGPEDVRSALALLESKGLVFQKPTPKTGNPGRPADAKFLFCKRPLDEHAAKIELLAIWSMWPPEPRGQNALKLAFIDWLKRLRPDLLTWPVEEGHDRTEDVMHWLLEISRDTDL